MRGTVCRVEGLETVAWAEYAGRVRENSLSNPVVDITATAVGTAYMRAAVDVAGGAEESVPLAPPDAALAFLMVSARTDGVTASFDEVAWFSIAQPLLLAGDVTAALGLPTPQSLLLRNSNPDVATVDIVVLRATA